MLCSRPWYSSAEIRKQQRLRRGLEHQTARPDARERHEREWVGVGEAECEQRNTERGARPGDRGPRAQPPSARGVDQAGCHGSEARDAGHDAVADGADIEAIIGQCRQERQVRKSDHHHTDGHQRDQPHLVVGADVPDSVEDLTER